MYGIILDTYFIPDEYWEWVKEHKAKQPSNADEAMRSESKSLHTANEIMLELMHSEPE